MTTFAYVQVPSKLVSPNTYISIKSKKSIHSLIFIFTSNFFSHLFLFFTIHSGSAHSIKAWGHAYYAREFPCRQNYIKRIKYLLLKYCSFRQLCNFLWDIYSCAIIIFAPGKIHHFLFIQFHYQLLLCLSLIIICDGFLSPQSWSICLLFMKFETNFIKNFYYCQAIKLPRYRSSFISGTSVGYVPL